jgi:YceI-like domain
MARPMTLLLAHPRDETGATPMQMKPPALALSLLLASAAQAAPLSGGGRASFLAHGPAGLKIVGTSEQLAVTSDDQQLVFSLPLRSLATGIDLRDKHMNEDLESARFPAVELRVLRSALQMPAKGAEVAGEVPGELTLHGQTRPVTVSYKAKRAESIDGSGTLKINLKEYGVQVRSYLGVTVKPDVDLEVAFHIVESA